VNDGPAGEEQWDETGWGGDRSWMMGWMGVVGYAGEGREEVQVQ